MKLSSTILSVIFITLIFSSTIFAQSRKYERKSVTSIGSVLYKTNPSSEVSDVVLNRLKVHLEVPRFDYNNISDNSIENFKKSSQKTDFSSASISKALKETILPQIEKILNKVREKRAKENLKEEDLARAIVEEMKGSGLDDQDIINIMNSAYIYLPVVTEYKEEQKKGSNSVKIKGYVLWYQLQLADNNNETIAVLVNSSNDIFTGMGSGTISEEYKLKRRTVKGKLFARIEAVDTWAQSLAVEMKNIPDFRLSAEVKSAEGSIVKANLGNKEGLGLDDGYDLTQKRNDEETGKEIIEEVGFFRVAEVSDNLNGDKKGSHFKQYFGENPERGMIIMERARLGINLTIKPKLFQLNMTKEDWSPLFEEDISSSAGIEAIFQKNLAKFTGISQLFVNAEIGLGFVTAKMNDDMNLTQPLIITAYLGASKKFWFSRMNLEVGAGYGYNAISFKNNDTELTYTANTYGAKFDAGLNYLINADLSAGVFLGYKYTTNIVSASVTDKDGDEVRTMYFPNNETNFTGLNYGISFSYALPSLPFNPFSFLTKDEIDY